MTAIDPALHAAPTEHAKTSPSTIREDLYKAQVAALQLLVMHMRQAEKDEAIPFEAFERAAGHVNRALRGLRTLRQANPKHPQNALPEKVVELHRKVVKHLEDLARIIERCSGDNDNGIKDFAAGAGFHDLCSVGIVEGLDALGDAMSVYFEDIAAQQRSDDQERTNRIAQEIGKIGRVINMVATNASIEAARVGDAGKGFTVIADEVKTLSKRVSTLSVSLTERLS